MRVFPFRKTRSSIRTRVLAIVLIPSAALLITGSTVTGVLVHDGIVARDFADYLGNYVDLAIQFGNVVQNERTVSLRAVGGDAQASADLQATRDQTNAIIQVVTGTTATASQTDSGADQAGSALAQLGARLPVLRQGIDLHQATAPDVDDYFTQLSNFVVLGVEGVARTSPDPHAAVEGVAATDLYKVSDTHSRAVGLAAGAASHGVLNLADRLTVGQVTGAYRDKLNDSLSRLTDSEKQSYQTLTTSPDWQLATGAEDSLVQRGVLGVPMNTWLDAENRISAQLGNLWGDHYRYAQNIAKDSASTTLLQAILAGIAVLILGIGAFLVAARLATGLVRRLRNLRTKILELANDKLPAMVRRLHEGEQADIDDDMFVSDQREDEIGEVAEAFNTAQRTAVEAAAAEAKTRGGINRVFLDIAHRSQIVVHRQLEVLDTAEAKQSDPEHLELLFKLDHLATRARRNAESLLILGGGQPGRKWRKPVALEEIVRSAISETEEFARVSAVRLPEVKVLGSAVADLLHLLAELVDNATSFSPPDAPVTVHGNLVGKGVVVEVEDQGLGIEFEEREALNETLRNPPAFQEMALAGQRNLGVFVIGQLAQRHGISVSLQESAYGGVKAIVLIPSTVLDESPGQMSDDSTSDFASAGVGRHRQRQGFLPETARDPIPRMPLEEGRMDQWPTEDSGSYPGTHPSLPAYQAAQPQGSQQSPEAPQRPPTRKRAPLPQRRKQTHLVPQLKLDVDQQPPAANGEAGSGGARRLRSPDEARSSMSAFQRGTRQARNR